MPVVPVFDNIKDHVQRLLPNSFDSMVEAATFERKPYFDQHCANRLLHDMRTTANCAKIVIALRKRLSAFSVHVQNMVLCLLTYLIQEGPPEFLVEVANHKALAKAIFDIAVRAGPAATSADIARHSALSLILNLSYWCSGSANPEVAQLAELADQVRRATSPSIFDGVSCEPELHANRAARQSLPPPGATGLVGPSPSTRAERILVTAIPVVQYTDVQIENMLDLCTQLNNCIKACEERNVPPAEDEIVKEFAANVGAENERLRMMLSSGAELDNLDLLLTVAEEQMKALIKARGSVDNTQLEPASQHAVDSEERNNSTLSRKATTAPQQQDEDSPEKILNEEKKAENEETTQPKVSTDEQESTSLDHVSDGRIKNAENTSS